jgi:beta-galactosidase
MRTIMLLTIIFLLQVITGCRNEVKRRTISLEGTWKIAEGSMTEAPELYDHTVPVPGLISMATPAFKEVGPKVSDRRSLIQDDTLREAFWYYRTFNLDGPVPEVAIIKVAKAMFGTKVYLNGRDMGEHLPCFTPGYFDVKDALKTGINELRIRVGSSRNSIPPNIPDGFDFEKERYIPGIFDNVELILSGTPRIVTVQAAPEISDEQVRIQVRLKNKNKTDASRISFVVKETRSQKIAGKLTTNVNFSRNAEEKLVEVLFPIKSCRLWSPEDPFLYDLVVTTDGDEYETRFGMREFRYDTLSGQTILNGKPYFMRGTNITLYRFFEDTACKDLPWNNDWVRKLHQSFKQFHWNGVRYCIGLAPEEWYRIADEEGILIQNEFPIWYGGRGWCVWPAELKADELEKEYTEWMQEQWNHPSVVIWDASNETVSHDGRTEEIAEAVKKVRSLDMSNRPWDNSYSNVRSPGDVMELHPYHFYDPGFSLKDIARADINPGGQSGKTNFMKIINEYGWLWLNRDGSPTTLTMDLYKNLLGENSTVNQRRHLYATYLAAETEFWRCHRQCAAVLHFTTLAYSRKDGQTSDHFRDVGNVLYDDEFMKYMPDAFSPVGLMLDEWGDEIETGISHDFKIMVINDLEPEWEGKVWVRIFDQDRIISERSADINIPSFGQDSVRISLMTPVSPGTYTVIAFLERDKDKPVRSYREIPFKKSSD